MLSFTVYGTPIPQGSLKAFIPRNGKFPVVTSDNEKTMPWRQQVARTALAEIAKQSFQKIVRPHPVAIEVHFYFDRPKSVKKVASKTTKPDIDKLERALLDALKGVAFDDDAQVVQVNKRKDFGEPARAEIKVFLDVPEQRAAFDAGGQGSKCSGM